MLTTSSDLTVIRAETLFTSFVVEHNLPLSITDHAGPLFKKMFPDSDISKKYGCARTKTSNIVNVLASDVENMITEGMRSQPFSLATDGSTDFDDIKMYPILVKLYNSDIGRVVTLLLKLVESCISTGIAIFELIDSELKNVAFLGITV